MCNLYSLSRKLLFASVIINEKQKQSKYKVWELYPKNICTKCPIPQNHFYILSIDIFPILPRNPPQTPYIQEKKCTNAPFFYIVIHIYAKYQCQIVF